MNRALFIDLDGTIIKTVSGNDFPVDCNDWAFIDDILDAIKYYSDCNYIIIIVSNQGGIEVGHVNLEEFDNKFNIIRKQISDYIDSPVHGLYCPFISKEHFYRKPNPGMAYQAGLQLELSLRESIMVGDQISDEKFAKYAGIGNYINIKKFLNEFRQKHRGLI